MVHRPQVDQRLTRRTHHPCGDTHPSDQHLHHEGTYICGLYVDFPSVECLEDQGSMYTCLYSAPDCLFLSDSLFSLYSLTLLSHFHLPLFLPPSPPTLLSHPPLILPSPTIPSHSPLPHTLPLPYTGQVSPHQLPGSSGQHVCSLSPASAVPRSETGWVSTGWGKKGFTPYWM